MESQHGSYDMHFLPFFQMLGIDVKRTLGHRDIARHIAFTFKRHAENGPTIFSTLRLTLDKVMSERGKAFFTLLTWTSV